MELFGKIVNGSHSSWYFIGYVKANVSRDLFITHVVPKPSIFYNEVIGANRYYCSHFWLNFQATSKSDGYTGKSDEKVTSDNKIICNSYQRYKSRNRDYCSRFLVISEGKSRFAIVFVRFILGKLGFDGFIEPRGKMTSDMN